ncbi:hypothetical protein Cch01nite_38300 [Cellulomonas chitinilytica]|uniref:Uncharacterized protein n=1 Tax=Cellulomonas chitinilytica TaxID=398759 RepID=A0A919U399_9CELL|nr:hypothetical protein Cch01nite_38300 [Cellulomonas chitinilytica]
MPHCGQNPSVRPGAPSRPRPTFAPHAGQNRFASGTCGSAITEPSGSGTGAGGTVVRPAPSRAPRSRVDEVPTRRVVLDPVAAVRADPSAAVASRLELVRPVRVDCSEPGSAAAAPRSGCACANPVPRSVVADAGADVPDDGAVGAWGDPQTSQYPSS